MSGVRSGYPDPYLLDKVPISRVVGLFRVTFGVPPRVFDVHVSGGSVVPRGSHDNNVSEPDPRTESTSGRPDGTINLKSKEKTFHS